jgi:hypothetical protein
MLSSPWKMPASFHRVNDGRRFWIRNLDHEFDFVTGTVEADQFELRVQFCCDFDDEIRPVADGVENVFTGQSVLERGSANSDVIER